MSGLEFQEISNFIMASLPSLMSLISVVAVAIKVLSQFNALREDIKKEDSYKKVEEQVKVVLDENKELKKQIRTLVETVTKIHQKE